MSESRSAGAPRSQTGIAERLAWQAVLFAASPRRGDLRGLVPAWPLTPVRIRVHRNHAVEAALSVTTPYLHYGGWDPDWRLSDYDDSLSLAGLEPAGAAAPDPSGPSGDLGAPDAPDVELVWLDFSRLGTGMPVAALADWLGGRLAALASLSPAPIVLVGPDPDGPEGLTKALANALSGGNRVHLGDRRELAETLGERFFDLQRAELTGTRMSAAAALASARLLGASWLPAVLAPRAKAVVVDLDETLYAGVLGEDGIDGVRLSDAHVDLQRRLLDLRASGLFLAVASRNDEDQVEALLADRDDFPLGLADLDARAIGWTPKSESLARIAAELRIDPAAMVFLDDNPGELIEAALANPGLRLVQARPDAAASNRALVGTPGIFTFTTTAEDGLRSADLAANADRSAALSAAADPGAYFRELGVRLRVGQNREAELPRLGAMPAKTNQFNLALARSTPAQVAAWLEDPRWQVSSAALSDRLSDSGIIALLVAHRDGSTLLVEELCVSCRAMGRRLEDLIVARMLVDGPLWPGTEAVSFRVAEGPRNHPARDWLARLAGAVDRVGDATVTVAAAHIEAVGENPDVEVEVST